MCRVSVIVPVYNGEKYIDECMYSIINQTLDDIEIICINDGSIDATGKILDTYTENNAGIHVVHKENTGYGHSMNIGIEMAKGEYIGLVEADDYVDLKMYEDLYSCAKENDADFVKADFHTFYGDGDTRTCVYVPIFARKEDRDLYEHSLNYKSDMRMMNNYVVTWAGIYKRDFLKNNGIQHNETLGASYQDNGFWYQVMIHAKKAYFINRPYYFARRDNESSSIYDPRKVFTTCDEYAFIRNYICKQGQDTKQLLALQWKNLFTIHENDMMRISKEFYHEFAHRFRKEFTDAIAAGEFDIRMLSEAEQQRLQLLLDDADGYVSTYFFIGDNTLETLRNAEQIIIYGSKWNGKRVLKLLQSYGFGEKISGIVVSDLCGRTEVIESIFVQNFNDAEIEKNALFVIATSEKFQDEVIDTIVAEEYRYRLTWQELSL